jgi:hypothetical protein
MRGAYLGVLIEPVLPPFGFGEWQALDLSGWDGDAADPRLARLVEHVRDRLDGRADIPADTGFAARLAPPRPRRGKLRPGLAAAALAAFAVAAAAAWLFRPSAPPPSPTAFVNERLAGAECAWLQIARVAPADGGGERLALAGIAAAPEALQASAMRAAIEGGVALAELDVADVAVSPPETCAELELLRRFRWQGRSRLTIIPPRGELRRTEYGWSGRFEFEADYAALPPRAALLGLDSVGGIEMLLPDLHAFRRAQPPLRSNGSVAAYEGYFFDDNRGARNVGLILMTADAPIDAALVGAIGRRSDRDFLDRLDRTAAAQNWQFELALVRCGFESGEGRRC